jgi:lysophospholipase L1-like esterase
MSDPTTLPGSASLALWIRADRGITLAPEMSPTRVISGATIALSGNLAQALCIYINCSKPGGVGTGEFYWSVDSGTTLNGPVVVQSSNPLGSTGITATITGGMGLSDIFEACVAQVTSQDGNHWVLTSSTGQRPVLDYSNSGGQISFRLDGYDDNLVCTSAGSVAWAAGNDTPFTVYSVSHGPAASPGGGGTVWSAHDPNAGGQAQFYLQVDYASAQWVPWKIADAGDQQLAGSGAGSMDIHGLQIVESYTDGQLFNLLENGVVKMTNVNLNTTAANNIAAFSIGVNRVRSGFNQATNGYINEIIAYTGNQHAVNSTQITAYLQARYVDLVSTAIPDSMFWNSGRADKAQFPPAWIPNDYKVRDTSARLVAVGSGPLTVRAVPNFSQGECRGVGIWKDGVYATELAYSGPLGIVDSRTYDPGDGLTHRIELEDNASLVGVSGSYTLQNPAAPQISVVCWGDSITNGAPGPSARWKTWANKLRHALTPAAQYGTTIWGIGGIALRDYTTGAPAVADTTAKLLARNNGTSKRLLVFRLGGNDWASGFSNVYLTHLRDITASLHAADPALKILMVGPIRAPGVDTVPDAFGHTLQYIDDCIQTVVAENPTFCSYLSHWTLMSSPGDYSDDLVHPNDSGHAKMAASIIPAVQALLPPDPIVSVGGNNFVIKRVYDATRVPPLYLWD